MSHFAQVLLGIFVMFLSGVLGIAISLFFREKRRMRELCARTGGKPCYRCGILATDEFMNLSYCHMCREVVVRVYPSVSFDPPYGFPGGAGYTGFRGIEERRKKKES